jgi:hypothetical protein
MRIASFLVLALILTFCPSCAQTNIATDAIAQMSVDEFNAGLFHWMDLHPKEFPRGTVLNVDYPILDLYSSKGISIYHGENSEKNAKFLRDFPESVDGSKVTSLRPTLKEAIEMVPDFRRQVGSLVSGAKYTAFVFTYVNWSQCKAQNEAIQELRKHAKESGIRILEVRLHP